MKNLFSNKYTLAGLASAALAVLLVASCGPKSGSTTSTDSTGTSASATSGAPSIDRGKYLVTAIGCNDCHTPWKMGAQGPEPDMSRMLSGHPAAMKIDRPAQVAPPWAWAGSMSMTAFSGPWGVSFSANLTPDSLTGIGSWTQDMFVSALRTGKHMGKGRPILPPMPWNWVGKLTDDDLASVFMYLKSIPPISNQVPDPVMGGAMAGGPPPAAPGNLPPGVMPPAQQGGAPPVPPPPAKHGKK